MTTRMATDSFRLRGITNDVYESTLRSMVIWCPNQTYEEWFISLLCEPRVRGMACIQVRLKENNRIVDPEPYGPPGFARASTTSFDVSRTVVSSSHAAQIFELHFVPDITFRFSDFIGMLRYHIPGYQMLEDGSWTQGWVLHVVDMLIKRGRLSPDSRSHLQQAIHTLRTTNPVAQVKVKDPIPSGVIYRA